MLNADDSMIGYFKKENDLQILICKFHFIKSINKHLPKDEDEKKKIINFIYKLSNTTNEEEFYNIYNLFKQQVNNNFINYFNEQWIKYINYWTSFNKTTTFGLQNINNYSETMIKQLKMAIKGKTFKTKSVPKVISILLVTIINQSYNNFTHKTTTEKDAIIKFLAAKKEFKKNNDLLFKLEYNKFIIKSFTKYELKNEYYELEIDKKRIKCSCEDFLINNKPCKHVYYYIFYYNNLKQINNDSNVFVFLRNFLIDIEININLNNTTYIPHFLPNGTHLNEIEDFVNKNKSSAKI
ncbi:hypothetical protein ABK040_012836 [Willaertia magna]